MAGNCKNCQKHLGDNWVNIIKVDWTAEEDEEGEINFYINSQEQVGEFCKDCLTIVKDNYNNHVTLAMGLEGWVNVLDANNHKEASCISKIVAEY